MTHAMNGLCGHSAVCCVPSSLPVGVFIRGLDLVLIGSEARQKMAQVHDTHKEETWSVGA